MKFTSVPLLVLLLAAAPALAQKVEIKPVLNVNPPPIATDKTVAYDYDIVYVRAPRYGDDKQSNWAEVFHPTVLDPGADLMLLHPDGNEELLVEGGQGSVADPYISFDGEWVYYAKFHNAEKGAPAAEAGSDLYKMHLPSRRIVQLTHGEFTPNTGAADWSRNHQFPVFNLGPCPLPGGRLMFTSNRQGYKPLKGYTTANLQLFVMDNDGKNVECIGHLNVNAALHPTILKDGRVLFSTYESQGRRDIRIWGLWSIHPDGSNWAPVISAFSHDLAVHFQTQLSDGSLIVEEYYNLNNNGFGTYLKLPPHARQGYAGFGSADPEDSRNLRLAGRSSMGHIFPMKFSPDGIEMLTPFARSSDWAAEPSVRADKESPRVGKVTHPSGAPDNHLLTVWSPGPATTNTAPRLPAVDGGIYLLKDGQPIEEPGQMLLIKNDPRYNECWPRAVVSYERIYGVAEPQRIAPTANDGKLSPHLPEGTPFGLVGTSSFYKRESYPGGGVPEGTVTAAWTGGRDDSGYENLGPFFSDSGGNWTSQGADVGKYGNDEIHAVRILAMEGTTNASGQRFRNHANERLRILGEIPLRKFHEGKQPLDPDGNPDTSFLAKIPADVAFTFQTLDRHGLVLNMSQTWHQLRPGEVRHDCGGCHAHSQQPTLFEETAAARPDYQLFDLTHHVPLLADKSRDETGPQWDSENKTGLRLTDATVVNVEYHRDIVPIFQRSCIACHSEKNGARPAAGLVLDDETEVAGLPGSYYRLAWESEKGWIDVKFGPPPISRSGTWGQPNGSRYVRKFQARRSLLAWKLMGRRMDGWSNDDFPSAATPGDFTTLTQAGERIWREDLTEREQHRLREQADLDYTGSIMPPPAAVKAGKVQPLSDEDRRTIFRWIDLGCPVDLDHALVTPERPSYGWLGDDKRPTLTIAAPAPGANAAVTRILIGMDDYYTGLDLSSFSVTTDFPVGDAPPGTNLATQFLQKSRGAWELRLPAPMTRAGRIAVSVKDNQGNISELVRSFNVEPAAK
ncbi:HzsA-related protein [Lignipirellula cremea]|uniref:Hydrazine synthase alpha subunit middle domain-containing protein n=1 Tax=Lignipirellula cremea TaxID=2528010 RepID=A0A518DKS8_9BACT|nr:hypothetical protein [Lignipirellula cremea]QDU92437.1 hypothetical protein Pla8534_01850 [Lignipirellula cremea]